MPTKNTDKLFNGEIKAGIAPGSHVVHIINQTGAENEIALPSSEEEISPKGANIKQIDVYSNKSDIAFGQKMVKWANTLQNAYEKIDNPDYKQWMENFKDYLVADSRSKQQEAVKALNKQRIEILNKYKDEEINDSYIGDVNSVMNSFGEMLGGNYKPLSENVPQKEEITEPSFSNVPGFFSTWVDRSDDVLFPHDPSPNDIKQGVGLQDCYMLAALTRIAEQNPQKIKDSMKDNGNGTVTVRFMNEDDPVDITVRKTESHVMGRGMHTYASGSLWVQMYEKAAAKYMDYLNERENEKENIDIRKRNEEKKANGKALIPEKKEYKPKGMSVLNYGFSSTFMNAFEGGHSYGDSPQVFGYGYQGYDGMDKIRPNGDSKEYNWKENMLYSMFKYTTDKKDEVLSVLTDGEGGRKNQILADGIRVKHVYTVLDTFESEGKKYVTLRDPYALFSSGYDEKGKLINTGSPVSGTVKAGTDTMGTFNMELVDFMNHFNAISGAKSTTIDRIGTLENYLTQVRETLVDNINTKDPKAVDLKNRIIETENRMFEFINDPKVSEEEKNIFFERIDRSSMMMKTPKQVSFVAGLMEKYFDPNLKEKPDFDKEFSVLFKKNEFEAPPFNKEEAEADKLLKDNSKAFHKQMEKLSKQLKEARSIWRNSDEYKQLENAVIEGKYCSPDKYVECKNKIVEAAKAYISHKAGANIDATSSKKLSFARVLEALEPSDEEKNADSVLNTKKENDRKLKKEFEAEQKAKAREKVGVKGISEKGKDYIQHKEKAPAKTNEKVNELN